MLDLISEIQSVYNTKLLLTEEADEDLWIQIVLSVDCDLDRVFDAEVYNAQ